MDAKELPARASLDQYEMLAKDFVNACTSGDPEALQRIKTISRDKGVTILIVEQKVREVLKIAHRVYVLRNGQVSFHGQAGKLNDDSKLRDVYL